MGQVIITLKDASKMEAFIEFIQHLDFVETTEVVEDSSTFSENEADTTSNGQHLYYEPQSSYSVADIEAIAQQFPSDKKWTYTEALDIFPPDLKVKLEILNNKLIIMAAPSILHQKISNRLSNRLTNFVEEKDLGDILVAPTDVKFDENNVEQPDILFISVKRNAIVKANVINGAPDLIVEIISPSNHKKEREEKRALYESRGVEEYWTIFPKKRYVKVELLSDGQYQTFSEVEKEGVIQSSVLDGFQIDIQELMPERFFAQEKE